MLFLECIQGIQNKIRHFIFSLYESPEKIYYLQMRSKIKWNKYDNLIKHDQSVSSRSYSGPGLNAVLGNFRLAVPGFLLLMRIVQTTKQISLEMSFL